MVAALLFSTAIVAASPTVPTPWFEMDDYPVRAFQRRQQGTTAFEVLVAPDGRPAACSVVKSSGSEILDNSACSITKNRIRFTPAADAAGHAAYGVYRTQVNWALDPENWSQSEVGPDFEVSLNKLPDNATGPVSVKYAVAVDAAGKVADCSVIGGLHAATLGQIGCDKLKADFHRTPAMPGIASIQTAWITFTR